MPVNTEKYDVSFRCYFQNNGEPNSTTHYCPAFPAKDIPKWISAYRFTHPTCVSVSCKVWFSGGESCNYAPDEED